MTTEFTPLSALGGGALIGLSAVLLMLFLGRIMGATGILAGALRPNSSTEFGWRAAVLIGMVSAPLLLAAVTGYVPEVQVPAPTTFLIVGGLLVGVGVTFGGGCTSGHGVCGMARLSQRSLVATLTFMAATVITVFVMPHILGVY
jgi:uncharacterized membrane protein YedE/YeeE